MIRRRIDNTTKNNDHKMHQNSKNEKKQSMAVVVASRIQVQNVCLVHLSHMGSHQSHSHIESHHPSEARNGPTPGLVSFGPFRYSRFDLPRLEFGGAAKSQTAST